MAGKKTPVISLIRTRAGQNERAYLQHCSVKIRVWREKWWDGSSSLKANHVLSRFRLQRRKDQFILSLYLSLSRDLSHMFVKRKTKKKNLTSVKRKKKEREVGGEVDYGASAEEGALMSWHLPQTKCGDIRWGGKNWTPSFWGDFADWNFEFRDLFWIRIICL